MWGLLFLYGNASITLGHNLVVQVRGKFFFFAYLRASDRHKLGGNALFGVGRAAMHFPFGLLNLVVVVFVVFLLILRIVVVHLQSKLLSYLALVAADLRPGDLHVLGGALVHGDGE